MLTCILKIEDVTSKKTCRYCKTQVIKKFSVYLRWTKQCLCDLYTGVPVLYREVVPIDTLAGGRLQGDTHHLSCLVKVNPDVVG